MIQVTNWKYADIGTAIAAADMTTMGSVCYVSDEGDGRRKMTVFLDTDGAKVALGNYAIAMKITTDQYATDTTTANTTLTGDRVAHIQSGDLIMEIRRGAKVEYSADLLDASLDPARSGTTPAVGDTLGIKGGLWSTLGAAAITPAPVIAKVHKVFGTNVVVELL